MTDYGVTSSGFVAKRLADIKAEIEASLKAALGENLNLLPESVLGQIVGIVSERESLLWELAEAVYNSQYPHSAEGISLDNVVALLGITRKAATKSTITGQLLFGVNGTVVPTGTILSVNGIPLNRFVTIEDSSPFIAGTNEIQRINYGAPPSVGTFKLKFRDEITTTALAHSCSAIDMQNALNNELSRLSGVTVVKDGSQQYAITFAGNDGKQDQPMLEIVDRTGGMLAITITITEFTKGVPQAIVDMISETAGKVTAPSGSLTVIETPVTGLERTINPEDADLGTNLETDAELRLRREESLQISGAGTVEAIRSKILELADVQQAYVFENDTMITDIYGRPPKSFEAVVQGGDEQLIANAIWLAKGAGIETYGGITKTVIDSQGFSQTIKFSRPTNISIWIELDLTIDADYPIDGDTQVKNALLAFGAALQIGQDVIVYPHLIASINAIAGITDVVTKIGIAPSPTLDNNIIIQPDELAVFDSGKITIISA